MSDYIFCAGLSLLAGFIFHIIDAKIIPWWHQLGYYFLGAFICDLVKWIIE